MRRFVFGILNVGNSKITIKNIAELMLRVWNFYIPVSVQRANHVLPHTLRVHYIPTA